MSIQELQEKLTEILLENDRIKKTSKQRYNQIKELKLKEKRLNILNSRFDSLKEFLLKGSFPIKIYEGIPRIEWSAMNAIRGLMAKDKTTTDVSVEGLYSVKINDEWKLARIKNYICWQIMFINDNEPMYNGLHFYDISKFVLLEIE